MEKANKKTSSVGAAPCEVKRDKGARQRGHARKNSERENKKQENERDVHKNVVRNSFTSTAGAVHIVVDCRTLGIQQSTGKPQR